MLNFLSIQNIVLINEAKLDFVENYNYKGGLFILSGETGSGKSILLDALGLAIGSRANVRLIGEASNSAVVIAEFDITNNLKCREILNNYQLLDQENSNFLRIRRIIYKDEANNHSSKIYVNDNSISLTLLTQIGNNLIEINGQHYQHGLLNSNIHHLILDEFANHQPSLQNLRSTVESLKIIDEKINSFNQELLQKQREQEYLNHIIAELESANIEEGEDERLKSIKNQMINRDKVVNFIGELNNFLNQSGSQLLMADRLISRQQNLINNFFNQEADNFEEDLKIINQQNEQLELIISKNDKLMRKFSSEDYNIAEIDERLFLIRNLMRKFDCKTEQFQALIDDAKNKLVNLNNEEKSFHNWQEEKNKLLAEYHQLAKKISDNRNKAGLELAQKVEEELIFLKMPRAKFKVKIESIYQNGDNNIYHQNGYDKVSFVVAINNDKFEDIAKVASGGELSRFMLALKVALINIKSVPTIIFDEIDSGIGGATASAVGRRLKFLAEKLQIFVVTHQPQIASQASQHFRISKTMVTNQQHQQVVNTIIEKLDEETRKNEIARMLSGDEVSEEALAVAKQLIQS